MLILEEQCDKQQLDTGQEVRATGHKPKQAMTHGRVTNARKTPEPGSVNHDPIR